jgi:2-polyprenyl-6-hydroxyphenyl methylase/3-demethylubiquinone-9 3-methyltransferase
VQERNLQVKQGVLNHSSHAEFVAYYAKQSQSPENVQRSRTICSKILKLLDERDGCGRKYQVLDVGCNAGTQSRVWAELGHHVHGLDINEALLNIARERTTAAGYEIDFRLGSAVELPWPDQSMDVCIAPELLEHVAEWRTCLDEFTRVLRPGGILYFNTTNVLCPVQEEFNLFGYSWYPARLKRHFERLAVTTRPALANYSVYPAVNWFTPYGLRKELARRGFATLDRFDLVDLSQKGKLARYVLASIRALPPLRLLAFVCTPGTTLFGRKN